MMGELLIFFELFQLLKISKYHSPTAQNEIQCIIFALETMICNYYILVVLVYIIYSYFGVSEDKGK